jgi:hypothetical protein
LEGSLYALRVRGVKGDDDIGFRLDFHHSLSLFIETASDCVTVSKHRQQTGQRRIAIRELFANVIVNLGSLCAARDAIEGDHGIHQLSGG